MISGFLDPSTGGIAIGGKPMVGIGPNQRPTALIFQNLALFPLMSVRENVAFGLEARGMAKAERRRRADDLLSLVALEGQGDKKPGELSGGERQRAAVARALITQPACVLADEPTGNLDRHSAEQVFELMLELNHDLGASLVIVTHDSELAARMDAVWRLADGMLTLEHGWRIPKNDL